MGDRDAILLDDLEALDPDRWCVASYDQLLADPDAEMRTTRRVLRSPLGHRARRTDLPLSRHTRSTRRIPTSGCATPRSSSRIGTRSPTSRCVPTACSPCRRGPSRSRAVARPTRHRPRRPRLRLPTPSGRRTSRSARVSFASGYTTRVPAGPRGHRSLMVSTYQSGRLIVVRSNERRAQHPLPRLPEPDGHRSGPDPRARHEGERAPVPEPARRDRTARRPRAPRRVLHAPALAHHRRYPDPRPRVHRRRALGREHAVLVPVDDRRPVQLRAALATPVRHRARPEDRCHLNGLCVIDDEPGSSPRSAIRDDVDGWRDTRSTAVSSSTSHRGSSSVGGCACPTRRAGTTGGCGCSSRGAACCRPSIWKPVTVPTSRPFPASPGALVRRAVRVRRTFAGARARLRRAAPHRRGRRPQLRRLGRRRANGVVVAWLKFDGSVAGDLRGPGPPGTRYPEIVEPRRTGRLRLLCLPDAALADVPADLRS